MPVLQYRMAFLAVVLPLTFLCYRPRAAGAAARRTERRGRPARAPLDWVLAGVGAGRLRVPAVRASTSSSAAPSPRPARRGHGRGLRAAGAGGNPAHRRADPARWSASRSSRTPTTAATSPSSMRARPPRLRPRPHHRRALHGHRGHLRRAARRRGDVHRAVHHLRRGAGLLGRRRSSSWTCRSPRSGAPVRRPAAPSRSPGSCSAPSPARARPRPCRWARSPGRSCAAPDTRASRRAGCSPPPASGRSCRRRRWARRRSSSPSTSTCRTCACCCSPPSRRCCTTWASCWRSSSTPGASAPAPSSVDAPPLGRLLLRYGYHFSSLVAIVVFMALDYSPFRSVVYATILAFALSMLDRGHRLTPVRTAKALSQGALGVLPVAATTAAAGVIVGRGHADRPGTEGVQPHRRRRGRRAWPSPRSWPRWPSCCSGLAVPVTASFIIAAVIIGPALQTLGVPVEAAYMFIFYFAVLSEVTPPTALAAVAASAVTGGNAFRTMMQTWKYTLPAFLVPFAFVLAPAGECAARPGAARRGRRLDGRVRAGGARPGGRHRRLARRPGPRPRAGGVRGRRRRPALPAPRGGGHRHRAARRRARTPPDLRRRGRPTATRARRRPRNPSRQEIPHDHPTTRHRRRGGRSPSPAGLDRLRRGEPDRGDDSGGQVQGRPAVHRHRQHDRRVLPARRRLRRPDHQARRRLPGDRRGHRRQRGEHPARRARRLRHRLHARRRRR